MDRVLSISRRPKRRKNWVQHRLDQPRQSSVDPSLTIRNSLFTSDVALQRMIDEAIVPALVDRFLQARKIAHNEET